MSAWALTDLLTPLSATLRRMQQSVGVAPPTRQMLQEEDHSSCALLRHLPQIKDKMAYRALGTCFPTPIHESTVITSSGTECHFYVKREDLSSDIYGGNKVRTLQFQLGVLESRITSGEPDVLPLTVIGTYGSNQNVATVVHIAKHLPALIPSLNVALLEPEVSDLDNTLNLLSVLSFRRARPLFNILPSMPAILRAAFWSKGTVLTLGGNSPSGCMGQVSAMLELAEQIDAGVAPDPDRIYIAIGSSCTISGLIIGVALSRHLGLRAFSAADFKICGVIIHHICASLQRNFNFHRRWGSTPLTIANTISATCRTMADLGVPDLTEPSLQILMTQVVLNDDKMLCGKYGGHSERSREAAKQYDATGATFSTSAGKHVPEKSIWLCGHFVAKPFAMMMDDLEDASRSGHDLKCLLWQTKSAVQPRGENNEWEQVAHLPEKTRTWMTEGKAESSLRPGSFNAFEGFAEDYQTVMTRVHLE